MHAEHYETERKGEDPCGFKKNKTKQETLFIFNGGIKLILLAKHTPGL